MSMVDISTAERRIAERVDPGIANQIAISDTAGGVAFRDAGEVMEFAKMMSVASGGIREHLRSNPGACLAILTQALEWGLSPFAVANKSYFVNNQIAFESQLVQAVILKRAPIKGRIKFEYSGAGQDRACRAWARLREEDEVVEYQSPKLKDIKPQNSPLWKNDPDQQLAYFSGRSLCRRHFPDVILGIYDREEIDDAPRIGPERARDVTPPRNLANKLDALAAQRQPEPAPEPEPAVETPRDPETGEISPATASTDDSGPSTGDSNDPPAEEEPLSPEDAVLTEVRHRMFQGERLTAVLNSLGDRRGLLTDEQVKALREAEKAKPAEKR